MDVRCVCVCANPTKALDFDKYILEGLGRELFNVKELSVSRLI